MSIKLGFPTAHTIILCIAALVAFMTFLVPAGQYDKLSYDSDKKLFIRSGQAAAQELEATQETLDQLNIRINVDKFINGDIYKPIGIPKTYHKLDPNPQGFIEFIKSPIRGMVGAIDVILLILIIGGYIGIVSHTGAFDSGIGWLADRMHGRETWLIIFVTSLIALAGTTIGFAEETIAFLPILIPVFLAARYDALVAVAAIFLGSSVGTMASTLNPFSIIIASDAAGINWSSGLYGRVFVLLGSLIISTWYIIRYANRVKKDPTKSLIYSQKKELEDKFLINNGKDELRSFSRSTQLVLLIFLISFIILIYGVAKKGWYFEEMTTIFLVGAIICGFVARIGEKKFINVFIKGASSLLGVALIVGLARGVTNLMEDGLISDTLLYYASNMVEGMPQSIFINVMFFLFAGLSFFIPSSSGMAVLTMPIMAPLADVVGLPREMIVDTYTFGPGLFGFINPTGLILPSLVMAGIGFNKWFKFILPLFFMIGLFIMAFLTIRILYLG